MPNLQVTFVFPLRFHLKLAAILFSMTAQNAMGLLFGIIHILKVDGLTIPKLYEFINLYISFKIFKRFRHVAIKHLRKKVIFWLIYPFLYGILSQHNFKYTFIDFLDQRNIRVAIYTEEIYQYAKIIGNFRLFLYYFTLKWRPSCFRCQRKT